MRPFGRIDLSRLRRLTFSSVRYDHIVLAVLALVAGVAAGYAAIGFRGLVRMVEVTAFGTGVEPFATWLLGDPAWWRILLPPIAGGMVLALIYRVLTEDFRARGVPDVIEANALRDGRMSLREGLVSGLANATALGFGASAGREGPVVHLGASIASWLAERLRLSPAVGRMLLACGVASAVAASFNAPIAGVFFALEVVMGHYAIHAFAPVVLASVAGTIVSRAYLGDFPAFIMPDLTIATYLELPAFALAGLAAAAAAMSLTTGIVRVEETAQKTGLPAWAWPPLGGLAVGLIALISPEVLGVGYEATDKALHGEYVLATLIVLLLAKLAATTLAVGLRFGSGVFSPSLFIGAMTGGTVGMLAASVNPDLASTPGLYAVVGMGAVAAAVLGAPVSTVLIIFELTGDYSVTIAVMIASAVAALVTGLVHRPSFFHWQLERRGLHLAGGKASYLLKATTVGEALDKNFATVNLATPLARVREMLLAQYGGKLLVTNDAGKLVGVITASDMSGESFDPALDQLVRAEDICRRDPVAIAAGESLEAALRLMEQSGEEHIPVIESADNRVVVGMLHHREVLRRYNQALVEAETEMRDIKRRL